MPAQRIVQGRLIMKVKSIKKTQGNINLSPNTCYQVVEIDDEHYRVINDIKEPILYPKELFTVVDDKFPSDWERIDYEDGEYYIGPKYFYRYFYEDYFDGDKMTIKIFNLYLEEILLSRNKSESKLI